MSSLVQPVREMTHGGYTFGSALALTDRQLSQFCELLNDPVLPVTSQLSGRGGVARRGIEGLGSVVVKHYRRGGTLSYFNARTYLWTGMVRPRAEFELLARVREFGVHAPEPLAYAYRGSILYRGWLFTREIEEYQSLADAASRFARPLEAIFISLAIQLRALISHRILHVDLHPGNVLVGSDGTVYLMDFDKARVFNGPERKLRDQYLRRWRRAVIKHRLPEQYSELLSAVLRRAEPPREELLTSV